MSTPQKWFLLMNNEVKGPYAEAEAKALASQTPECLVWGKGMGEWVKPDIWNETVKAVEETIQSLQADMTPQWRIRQGTYEAGPFTYDQLLQVLKAHPDAGECQLYSESEAELGWKNVYDFPVIVEEVGITRRQHQRVPISGLFRFEKEGSPKQDSLLSTISEGGLGIIEAQGLSIGDHVKGTIQSPQLPTAINCSCDVMYKQEDGSWGLKFVNLPLESKSLIVEYTQKFKA